VEVAQTQRLTSTATVTTRAFYDGAGRLVETRTQAPGGQDVVRYRYYDGAGAVEHESVAYFVAATSGCGCALDFAIPDSTQAGAGTAYDGAGRVVSATDAVGHVTSTAYAVTSGLNGDTGSYEQTPVVDPLGHQTATLTDAFGREGYAERYTGATAFSQSRTYDAGSELTALQTDLQGQTDVQAFCYDDQSRLTWASSASGPIPCGGTNTAGTLTSAAYTQSFGYDILGRLTIGPLEAYSYGDPAHVHAATAIGGTWTASYDAAGDLTCRAATSASTCAGGSPTGSPLTWDNEGRLVEWTSPTGAP
jgi:YD repeat-containing protein